jgi:hypothetical protein
MAINVYLGYPPPKIRKWIEDHSGNPKTVITFNNLDIEEYDWSGEVND